VEKTREGGKGAEGGAVKGVLLPNPTEQEGVLKDGGVNEWSGQRSKFDLVLTRG